MASIYLYRHTPSGQSRVYQVTQLRTDGVHCRPSAGTGPVVLKVVPNGCCLFRFYHGPIDVRLSFSTPTIGMKWACATQKVVVVVVDSHIQRIVRATTEETTATQQVIHRPIKCPSCSWSQRGMKVNGLHDGDNPLLRPTGIQIAIKHLPDSTIREHRKRIGVQTMS